MFAKRPILSSALVAGTAIGGAYLYADYQDLWDDKSIERRDENAVDVQRPEIGEAQPTVLPNSEQATAHGAGEAPAQGTTPDTEVQTFPLPPTGPIEEQDLPPLPNPSKEASTPLASRPSRETPILTNPSSDMASRPHPASREGNRQAKRPSPAVMPDYSDQNPKPPPSLPQTLWERASSWAESSWQRVRQEARDFFDPPPPVEPILQRNQPAGAACVRKTPLPNLFASGLATNPWATQEASPCAPVYRMDHDLLNRREGGLFVQAYVPGYHVRDPNNPGHVTVARKRNDEAMKHSGVTIGVGVDLSSKSPEKLRKTLNNYIKRHGNPDKVDVEDIISKLKPFMEQNGRKHGPIGWNAVRAVGDDPPVFERAEAELLSAAVREENVQNMEQQFNAHNTMGATFQQLPGEVQTVLLDFTYQYGPADEIYLRSDPKRSKPEARAMRKTLWEAYYRGDWQGIAQRLQNGDIPDKRKSPAFMGRRQEEGKLLQRAIDRRTLPENGNPCAPTPHTQAFLPSYRRFWS